MRKWGRYGWEGRDYFWNDPQKTERFWDTLLGFLVFFSIPIAAIFFMFLFIWR